MKYEKLSRDNYAFQEIDKKVCTMMKSNGFKILSFLPKWYNKCYVSIILKRFLKYFRGKEID